MKEPIFKVNGDVVEMRFDDTNDPMILSMTQTQLRDVIRAHPEIEKMYRFFQANRGVKYG